MSLVGDFHQWIAGVMQEEPFASYFAELDVISDVPDITKGFPQLTGDTHFAVTVANKEAYQEQTTAYISIWYEPLTPLDGNTADDISLHLIERIHRKTTPQRVNIMAGMSQPLRDNEAPAHRVRIQLILKRV